jgi:hypothetical protein
VTKITQVALRKRCDHPVNKQHARLSINEDISVAAAVVAVAVAVAVGDLAALIIRATIARETNQPRR